jgi:O-antigen ligase
MVRVGAVFLLVLAIIWTVYLVATVRLGLAVVAAIAAIALSVHVLLTGKEVTRYVENYDNTPHQRPDSG